MAQGLQLNQSTEFGGLGTQSFTIVTAGPYVCSVNMSLPYKDSASGDSSVTTGSSSVSVVIKQGSTTLLTLASPSTGQRSLGGSVGMLCAAADVITVVATSSAAADNLANAIKGVINLYQGQ